MKFHPSRPPAAAQPHHHPLAKTRLYAPRVAAEQIADEAAQVRLMTDQADCSVPPFESAVQRLPKLGVVVSGQLAEQLEPPTPDVRDQRRGGLGGAGIGAREQPVEAEIEGDKGAGQRVGLPLPLAAQRAQVIVRVVRIALTGVRVAD